MRPAWRLGVAILILAVVVLLVVLFPWIMGRLPEQTAEISAKHEQARAASALSNVKQLAPAMQAFVGKPGEYNAPAQRAYEVQQETMYAMNEELAARPGAPPTEARVTVPVGYPLQAPESTDANLTLAVHYKKQEDVYLTTYDADFKGDYVFKNPNAKYPSRIVLTFPFAPNVNTLSNLKMTVNDKEATQTRTTMKGITWADWFKPGEAKTIHVEYDAQGIDEYGYAVDHDRLNKSFRLVATVAGVDELKLPNDCLRVEKQEKNKDGFKLTWYHQGLVTNRDIKIDLPDKEPELTLAARLQKYAGRFALLCRVAPIFALFFVGAMGLSGRVGAPKLSAESQVLLALNFLLFFPLVIFVASFTGVAAAFWIGLAVTALINALYAWRQAGVGMLWRVLVFTAIFLGLFSYGILHARLTGLLLSAGGVAIVAFFMLSHGLWPPEPHGKPEAPGEQQGPGVPAVAAAGNPPPKGRGSFCPYCGMVLGASFKFCPGCARPVHETIACKQCGAQVCGACGREFKYCPACGAGL